MLHFVLGWINFKLMTSRLDCQAITVSDHVSHLSDSQKLNSTKTYVLVLKMLKKKKKKENWQKIPCMSNTGLEWDGDNKTPLKFQIFCRIIWCLNVIGSMHITSTKNHAFATTTSPNLERLIYTSDLRGYTSAKDALTAILMTQNTCSNKCLLKQVQSQSSQCQQSHISNLSLSVSKTLTDACSVTL